MTELVAAAMLLQAGGSAKKKTHTPFPQPTFPNNHHTQLPLLRLRLHMILGGVAFQYVHGALAQLAHRLHVPAPSPLRDAGFALLPELGRERQWVSEALFTALFTAFAVWTATPFVTAGRPRFYTVTLSSRVLTVLVVCQSLRAASFLATGLPAPNYHCRSGAPTATRPMPAAWWGHAALDVARVTAHGCGDLIFSSHTTFALTGALAYNEWGTVQAVKAVVWAAVGLLSLLIIASRKHYTVDVLVAWYVVPAVFVLARRRWKRERGRGDPAAERDHWGARAAPTALPRSCPSCGCLVDGAASGHGSGGGTPPRAKQRRAGGSAAELAALASVRVVDG